jgi:hypothetical protein
LSKALLVTVTLVELVELPEAAPVDVKLIVSIPFAVTVVVEPAAVPEPLIVKDISSAVPVVPEAGDNVRLRDVEIKLAFKIEV